MTDGLSFAILGGYGQLGRAVAALLLDRGAERVTIAGRSFEKADDAARDLARRDAAGQVKSVRAEADHVDGLGALLSGHDVVIHAAPLDGAASTALVAALTRTGGWLVLVSHDAAVIADLQAARAALDRAGAQVIVDAGADPGLPGLVGHLAAETHGAAERVEIWARYRAPEVGRAGLADILDGATDAAWIYAGGWRRAGLFEVRRRAWPGGLGASVAMPVYFPELDVLRRRHGLRWLALCHGGLNGPADMVVSMRRVLGRMFPRDVGLAALKATMRIANPPPYGLGISAIAAGRGRQTEVLLSHSDVYAATAEIAAWCAEDLVRDLHPAPSVRVAFELLCDGDAKKGLLARGFDLSFR
jgi:hypothetical protein